MFQMAPSLLPGKAGHKYTREKLHRQTRGSPAYAIVYRSKQLSLKAKILFVYVGDGKLRRDAAVCLQFRTDSLHGLLLTILFRNLKCLLL